MEVDRLIDFLVEEKTKPEVVASQAIPRDVINSPPAGMTPVADASDKRDELAAVALGGKSRLYLGRALTPDQIDAMSDDEIGKLYSRYKTRLGAVAAHSLGKGILQIYGQLVSLWWPNVDQTSLVADLDANPFIAHSLGIASCRAYQTVGMALAPLSVALITLQHSTSRDNASIEPDCPLVKDNYQANGGANSSNGAANSSENTQPQTSGSG